MLKQTTVTIEHFFTDGERMQLFYSEGDNGKSTYILKLIGADGKTIGKETLNVGERIITTTEVSSDKEEHFKARIAIAQETNLHPKL